MTGFTEYRYWSPVLGCDASRLSVFDQHGAEYWSIIERPSMGKRYRESRQEALELIVEAIERGQEPGEVWQTTTPNRL